MKAIKLFLITITIGLSTMYSQGQNIEKDIKMYTQVWDDIVNKGEIDKINSTYFDTNITAIQSPENIVGIENFKAYYQNFITGFSNVEFTIINVFGHGN
ncbi:MAG: nuclear transport factor 2 family protein, partial [Psychroserpens sp.]|nr:nuclear transport factor 2 family protein [Psychroserpens sp.]